MRTATSTRCRWSGKLLRLVFAAGLVALSIVVVLLSVRLNAALVSAQRSVERAVKAEASLARSEQDLAEAQKKVEELTARLKEESFEKERLLLQIQVRDNPARDGVDASIVKYDKRRAKILARCQLSDNPLCGLEPNDPSAIDRKAAPGPVSSVPR